MADKVSISIEADVAQLEGALRRATTAFAQATNSITEIAERLGAQTKQAFEGLGSAAETARSSVAGPVDAIVLAIRDMRNQVVDALSSIRRVLQDQAPSAFDKATEGFAKLVGSAGRSGKQIGETISAVKDILGGASVAFQKYMKEGAGLFDLNRETGASVEFLSRLAFAARTAGVDFEGFKSGIEGLSRNVGAALRDPLSEAGRAFKSLGIDARFLQEHQHDLPALIQRIADAYARLPPEADRAAVATALFNRQGAGIASAFEHGAVGLNKLGQEADRLGRTMSTDAATQFKATAESLDLLNAKIEAWTRNAAAAVAPKIAQQEKSEREKLIEKMHELQDLIEQLERTKEQMASVMGKSGEASQPFFARALVDLAARIQKVRQEVEELKKSLGSLPADGGSGSGQVTDAPVGGERADAGTTSATPQSPRSVGNVDIAAPISAQLQQVRAAEEEYADETRRLWNELWHGKAEAARQALTETRTALRAGIAAEGQAERDAGTQSVQQERQTQGQRLAVRSSAKNEAAALAREEAKTEIELAKLRLQAEREVLDAEVALGEITATEKIEQMKKLTEAEWQLELQALQNQRNADNLSELEKKRIDDRIEVLQAKHNVDMLKLNLQLTTETVRQWRQMLQPIEQGFNQLFGDLIRGGTHLRQTMAQIAGNIVTSFVQARIRIEVNWLAGQLAMALGAQEWAEKSLLSWLFSILGVKTAQVAADKEKVGQAAATSAAVGAIGLQQSLAQVHEAAIVAGANAYAATAAIPIVGPELAPAAAAEATTTVEAMGAALAFAAGGAPGLAVGAWNIPSEMLAVLHPGEAVVPADFATGLRQSGRLGGNADAAGGGDVHFHVTAMDSRDVSSFFKRNGAALAKALSGERRNFNPRLAAAMR